jgi:hypothetical protein
MVLFILVLSRLCSQCFNDTPNLGIGNGFGKQPAIRQCLGIGARLGAWFQHKTGINGKKSQNAPRQ